ncbi:transcriptional regulator [Jidongwangia harbinensis]|uniref:transcriptional regulator n=1 Tax=Jidongwangia harbinensis TaxID=2878561 RepID=UPI001CDA0B7B|nr:transcriptional regulator [Jidongwangia harbinensis]MCA2218204.1 transcriptional regulator [Jidongwangia harbinensis]
MSRTSPPDLLVLHAVRLGGMAGNRAVARRFGLDPAATDELLLDHQAYGWVTWSEFAGSGGWSLTGRGRAENERRLAAELREVPGGDATVRRVHAAFLPLNGRLQRACTDWQIRPAPGAPLATNDHRDPAWDGRVLRELGTLAAEVAPLVAELTATLERFRGYDTRFAAALARATAGEPSWVDRSGADSCHVVWFELHEDLIATLGLSRGGGG